MDPAEIALETALQSSPEDWSIRLLVAEKMYQRGAAEEAAQLINAAPVIPATGEELQKAATYGGVGAIPLVQSYVTAHPVDAYGHQVLGHLFEMAGDAAKAQEHLQAAGALGGATAVNLTPVVPEQVPADYQQPVQPLPVQGHTTQPLPPAGNITQPLPPAQPLAQAEPQQPAGPISQPLPQGQQIPQVGPISQPLPQGQQIPQVGPISQPLPQGQQIPQAGPISQPLPQGQQIPQAGPISQPLPQGQQIPQAGPVTQPMPQEAVGIPQITENLNVPPISNITQAPDGLATQEEYYEEPAPAVFQSSKGPDKPQNNGGKTTTAIFVAIAVHAVIALLALFLVILPEAKDEPEIVAAVIGPPAAKQEMQKKNVVKQVKKSTSASAAAAPVAQLMRANAMAKFALPQVTRTSTGPLGMGEGDLGSGGFGGTGTGFGSGASFFGGTATGQRFLFILDHSRSMKSNQVKLRNEELERVLRSLKGVEYQVLLFAGPSYYCFPGWRIASTNDSKATVFDPSGKAYKFGTNPKAEWLKSTSSNRQKTMSFLKKNPLALGTNWDTAFEAGFEMNPPPDVIFFMADGTGNSNPGKIRSMAGRKGKPVINTVAMQTATGKEKFAEVAKNSKGTFTIVDKRGKPIDGFEYIKNPGKFAGRL